MTYDPEARRDTPMALNLKERIRCEGPITVTEYMQACLYDPEHGYYVKRPAIGAAGDFITAPEISQVFGELIGLWCAVVWQQMGSPPAVNFVELGPGRGTLMRDALRAAAMVPAFQHAVQVALVETSLALREEQRTTLQAWQGPVAWYSNVEDLPAGPALVIANEFLDTCPVAQLEFDEHHYFHRGVGLDANGVLQFVRVGEAMTLTPRLHPGGREESQDFSFVVALRRRMGSSPCAMLFVDYGYTEPTFGETLQGVRKHEFEHPLTSPGEADLTVQVDFSDFRHYAELDVEPKAPNLIVDGPITQAEFLGRLGIIERASRLMAANPAKAGEIETGVARLMAPNGMGTRFKAIGIRSPQLAKLPGFA